MFNQEMPTSYEPRRYMVRGVLNSPTIGTFFEIVVAGSTDIVDWHTDYNKAVALADSLEQRFKNLNSTKE